MKIFFETENGFILESTSQTEQDIVLNFYGTGYHELLSNIKTDPLFDEVDGGIDLDKYLIVKGKVIHK